MSGSANSLMSVAQSASAFRQFFVARGTDLVSTGLEDLVKAALVFYEQVPASGLTDGSQADMLLFQFGIYDWGSGENFEFDLTRQFIIAGKHDDDAISQLRCTSLYVPTDALRAVGSGDRWCGSRHDLPAFRTFICSSEAYRTAVRLRSHHRRVVWSPV